MQADMQVAWEEMEKAFGKVSSDLKSMTPDGKDVRSVKADVRIDVSSEPLDFEREDIDVAIRFGDGIYPGLLVDKLFHGSPEQLVAQLVEDESLTADDLKRLRAMLATV